MSDIHDQFELCHLLDSMFVNDGIIDSHIGSFNEFMHTGIPNIINKIFSIKFEYANVASLGKAAKELDKNITKYVIEVIITKIELTPPVAYNYNVQKSQLLMPNEALLKDLTYCSPLHIDATITATAYLINGTTEVKSEKVENYLMAKIPIMVGTKLCNTFDKSKEALYKMQEDPTSIGGFFIVKGNSYVVTGLEGMKYNELRCFRHSKAFAKELSRGDIISKPGGAFENSFRMLLVLGTNHGIGVNMGSAGFKDVAIPFFLLFGALGVTSRKRITELICYSLDAGNPIVKQMLALIRDALQVSYPGFERCNTMVDTTDILEYLCDFLKYTPVAKKKGAAVDLITDNETILNVRKSAVTKLLTTLDLNLLPHVGMTKNDRVRKAKYLGFMIRKLLLTNLQVLPSFDRDSYEHKRVRSSGEMYSRGFKTQFNFFFVQKIRRGFGEELAKQSFKNLSLLGTFSKSFRPEDFEKALITMIVSGDKTMVINQMTTQNRLSSQQMHPKNKLNVLVSLKNIDTPNSESTTSSDRATVIRQFHPTCIGYVCGVTSHDTGAKIGMNKQMAISCNITNTGSLEILKDILLGDPDLIPDDDAFDVGRIVRDNLHRVLTNGESMGFVKDWKAYLAKYRAARREGRLHPLTGICSDLQFNVINFWVDSGRLFRPLLIAYDEDENVGKKDEKIAKNESSGFDKNIKLGKKEKEEGRVRTPEEAEHCISGAGLIAPTGQYTKVTQVLIEELKAGKLDITDFVERGIVEFITPEEQTNCYLAFELDEFKRNNRRNGKNRVSTLNHWDLADLESSDSTDLSTSTNPTALIESLKPSNRYTHIDIPQAIMSIVALTSVYANYNQSTRVCFQTNQVKQCNSWALKNWPFTAYKDLFIQIANEQPLVSTLSYKYLPPMGLNAIVAVNIYGGYNQDDATIINQASVDRGMFDAVHLTFQKTECEENEIVGRPDPLSTTDLKSYANYDKLVDGVVPVGTRIEENDVLVGKVAKLLKADITDPTRTFTDRSLVYKTKEPVYVHSVIQDRNNEEKKFIKIVFKSFRGAELGSKFSSRAGQKSVCGHLYHESDMPFTNTGMKPDIVFNTIGLVSRMTIGTPYEGMLAKICAHKGANADATMFKKFDIEDISRELAALGFEANGTERLYNGMNGTYLDCKIFIAPMYYQVLQKYTVDTVYSQDKSPTDVLTKLPLHGRKLLGGVRFGSMETSVLSTNSVNALHERMTSHADGFTVYVCRGCGHQGSVNVAVDLYKCNRCGTGCQLEQVDTTWTSNLLLGEIATMGVGTRFKLTRPIYEVFL